MGFLLYLEIKKNTFAAFYIKVLPATESHNTDPPELRIQMNKVSQIERIHLSTASFCTNYPPHVVYPQAFNLGPQTTPLSVFPPSL